MRIPISFSLLFLCGCSAAELRDSAAIVEEVAPVVASAAAHVATSANPATGLVMAAATIVSALLRTSMKGK